jgi:hypothetical protein
LAVLPDDLGKGWKIGHVFSQMATGELRMIRIDEMQTGRDAVLLRVEGVLDYQSVIVLEGVCHRYLKKEKGIVLELGGLLHITREGRKFLQEIEDRVGLLNVPEFVNLSPRS